MSIHSKCSIVGGSGFNLDMDFEDAKASRCTSFTLVDGGGFLIYYLPRRNAADKGPVKAFPDGFRMLAGNPYKRSFDGSPMANAIGINCIGGKSKPTKKHEFPTENCPDAMRMEIMFPSCWDGKNLDSANHQSHVAWPIGGENGPCPEGFPVRIETLFYEVWWSTDPWKNRWKEAKNPSQPFVLSTGDPTGYSLHGDFLNGWDGKVLQKAIEECTAESGVIEECPVFDLYDYKDPANKCFQSPAINEKTTGTLPALPGCNPIFAGPEDVTVCTEKKLPAINKQITVSGGLAGGEHTLPVKTKSGDPVRSDSTSQTARASTSSLRQNTLEPTPLPSSPSTTDPETPQIATLDETVTFDNEAPVSASDSTGDPVSPPIKTSSSLWIALAIVLVLALLLGLVLCRRNQPATARESSLGSEEKLGAWLQAPIRMVRLRVAPSWPLASLRSVSRRSFASSTSTTFPEAAAAPPKGPASAPGVVGSAPELSRHLLIHTPHPTATWPSHLHATSPLAKLLQDKWQTQPELAKLGFNFTDGGQGTVAQAWDPSRTKFDDPPADAAVERYSAVIYPDFVELPSFSIDDLPAFEKVLAELPAASAPLPSTTSGDATTLQRTHIFVCTHRTRDCRCGDIGEPLYDALLHEIKRRKLGGELKSGTDGVRIARVAHIGGHKWAGNALVYRSDGVGDWYGLLRAEDAPKLLDYATSPSSLPWFSRWRGRLGLSSDQVRAAYASRPAAEAENKLDEPRHELGDSVELVFKTFEGEERRVSGYEGESVMETARRHELPSILATCGGHCECATCHVLIPPAASAGGDPPLPEMTDEEDEQLEFAIGATDDSRLACQLPVTKELGKWIAKGGRIQLPRY
ncbi:hypothetical protein B0A53_05639 [Rhodotorula sp. CCFEE 5036]|nr:hypothetical protein B0A53_05639 [Rhodotorula sp. CCFEE 5036]